MRLSHLTYFDHKLVLTLGSTSPHYTRLTARGVKQPAVFSFRTEEEAKHKYAELLDILINHDGVYIGSKEKRKAKTSRKRAR